jgi:hypothetical protein
MIYNDKHFYTTTQFIKWCKEQEYNDTKILDLLKNEWHHKQMDCLSILEYYYKCNEVKENE